ncbi:MAG: ammonium transporter [Candidatus Sumerlaeia bacterium]|nr:ammonium transporter [Candidatus Sumerlaeia bacterium]
MNCFLHHPMKCADWLTKKGSGAITALLLLLLIVGLVATPTITTAQEATLESVTEAAADVVETVTEEVSEPALADVLSKSNLSPEVQAALVQSLEAANAGASAAASATANANNSWVLISSALVLMMTIPGLMLFYGGLVRSKNVLSVMMQCFLSCAIVSVLWMIYGYSLTYSTVTFEGDKVPFLNQIFGDLSLFLLAGVESMDPVSITNVVFQATFAIITPALIVGAFAERFRFRAFVPFLILWVTFVYIPLARMVWSSQGFFKNTYKEIMGIDPLDFAGGNVVHISSGVSALVLAIYLGKRRGWPGNDFAPHNLVIAAIGAGLLWVGWFGFNAGSALSSGNQASLAFLATHFSAASAALTWTFAEWITRGKPSLLGMISGVVAGLVGVTPAAGYISPLAGLIIGIVTGLVCFTVVTYVKPALKVDDSLDVFGIHGCGGMVGATLTGVFASAAFNGPDLAAHGATRVALILSQVGSIIITALMAGILTLVFVVIIDKVIGIRPNEEEELVGLDLVDHGEMGYHKLS